MRAPAGSLCKAVARYFCARPLGRFAKQWRAFCARRAVFVKQGRAIFAHARWVLLQSRSALFLRTPAGSFCKAEARLLRPTGRRSSPFVRRPRASIHRPQRPALPSLCPPPRTPAFPSSWLRFLSPCTPSPPRAPTLLFALLPPRAPTLPSVFSVSPARPRHHPLFHTVRPAAAPVSPCAAPPFPPPFLIQRASIAKENAVRTNAARRAASLPAPPV